MSGKGQGQGVSAGGGREGNGRENHQGQGGRNDGVRQKRGANSNYLLIMIQTFSVKLSSGDKFRM